MRGIAIIILAFIVGVGIGRFSPIDMVSISEEYSMYILYIMMILVGITIGHDKERLKVLLRPSWRTLLVPFGTIVGTLLGTVVISALISGRTLTECLAVGSGFGYYSLSSILISELHSAELGTVALLSNVLRELFTIALAPLLVVCFGPLSVISCGGATTMDTTLPFITRYSGEAFVLTAILHGILVDLSVPILVTLFCSL